MKVYCNECRYIKNWGSFTWPDCHKEKVVYDTPFTVKSGYGYKGRPEEKNKNNDCPDFQLGFWGFILFRPLRLMRQKSARQGSE